MVCMQDSMTRMNDVRNGVFVIAVLFTDGFVPLTWWLLWRVFVKFVGCLMCLAVILRNDNKSRESIAWYGTKSSELVRGMNLWKLMTWNENVTY